jgi:hypothetical protein
MRFTEAVVESDRAAVPFRDEPRGTCGARRDRALLRNDARDLAESARDVGVRERFGQTLRVQQDGSELLVGPGERSRRPTDPRRQAVFSPSRLAS